MSESQLTVSVDSKGAPIFTLVGAILGLVLSLVVGPVVSWLLDRFDSAPVVLRLMDLTPWSIPVLGLLGAAAGWFVFAVWDSEVGRVVVAADRVRIISEKASAVFDHHEIAEVFMDKDELVLLDGDTRELSRSTSEASLAPKLKRAFLTYGYPWRGVTDPREAVYSEWTDRSADLCGSIHALLRKRRRALEDHRSGEAENLREALAEQGVVVRDRDSKQQLRLIAED
ncbi:hypothetical protein GCM10009720_20600 [Yaniella flava]|uniref:Uncharacterized protein n=1 Tax=Yaniella flava TaxID=287930 RepID=A0ABN2UME3_9MICC